MRRFLGFVVRLLVVGAIATAILGLWRARSRSVHPEREPEAPFPFPPARGFSAPRHVHIPDVVEPGGGPETEQTILTEEPWIEPVAGACPSSHPVKAKLSSGIYHLPGGLNYERTVADRCYVDAPTADADGLRPSKT